MKITHVRVFHTGSLFFMVDPIERPISDKTKKRIEVLVLYFKIVKHGETCILKILTMKDPETKKNKEELYFQDKLIGVI